MSLVDTVKNAFVPIHREGYPFIAAFGAATLFLGYFSSILFWIGLILTAWCVYFFRDPERVTPSDDSLVVSPADGIISAVGPGRAAARARPRQCRNDPHFGVHECLFLPCEPRPGARPYRQDRTSAGKIPQCRTRQGQHRERAQRPGHREPHGTVAAVQIAGLVARRIVCWAEAGASIGTGERFGLIRFGSRVDVFLPLTATPRVAVGQTAVGGETVLAEFGGVAGTPRRADFLSGGHAIQEVRGPCQRRSAHPRDPDAHGAAQSGHRACHLRRPVRYRASASKAASNRRW